MASPNYLQYENTYQKYKNICHNKDVSTFRDSNFAGNSMQHQQQSQRAYHNNVDIDNNDQFENFEAKAENTMQTLSSDDEGGFRQQDLLCMKNQFNNSNNDSNNCNGTNGNACYSTKEIEPLLHSSHNRESIQILKVKCFNSF